MLPISGKTWVLSFFVIKAILMQAYTVIAAQVLIPAGTMLQLSEEQWQARFCNVRCLESTDWFEMLREVRFVQGETLYFRDIPSCSILEALHCCKDKPRAINQEISLPPGIPRASFDLITVCVPVTLRPLEELVWFEVVESEWQSGARVHSDSLRLSVKRPDKGKGRRAELISITTLSAAQERYHRASRKEKSILLDQWVAATGCHRKHVLRLFRRAAFPKS